MPYILLAMTSLLLLITIYVLTRPRNVTVLDTFLFFFLLQYGPHSLFISRFTWFGLQLSVETETRFLIGMTVAYLCLAAAILMASVLNRSNTSVETSVLPERSDRADLTAVVLTLGYVIFFMAIQGSPFLHITREYLRGFAGTSFFDYTELRRDMYGDSLYGAVTGLTRYTTTALLFAWLIGNVFPLRWMSAGLIGAAGLLFTVCAMQMNKFPFVYFFVLSAISVSRPDRRTLNRSKQGWLIGCAAIAGVGLLYGLYRIQYRELSNLRMIDTLDTIVYRTCFCSADSLRLWFDYFSGEGSLGFGGIRVFANALGLPYSNPTLIIPNVYVYAGAKTSFQTGFIGSGYAVGGLIGVACYSFTAGLLVSVFAKMQTADRRRADVFLFWNVLMMNMFWLTQIELHTAMLSGGAVSVVILMLLFKRLPKLSL